MNETILYHHPFSRYSIVRSLVMTDKVCSWCGQPRTRRGKLTHKLFKFGTQYDDDGFTSYSTKLFCSSSCCRSYFGYGNTWDKEI